MKRLLLLSSALLLAVAAHAHADPVYSFTTLDVPGSSFTEGEGINASGDVVGIYEDASGNQHPFLLSGGKYTTLDVPGSAHTVATAINASDQIVGSYLPAGGHVLVGFLYSNGKFMPLNAPGASSTTLTGINNLGQVVGYTGNRDNASGFLLSQGAYSPIKIPGAYSVDPGGINDSGQIVGNYNSPNDGYIQHGFLLNAGALTTLDAPIALSVTGDPLFTTVAGINNSGQIVGDFSEINVNHGFVLNQGVYTPFVAPGTSSTFTDAFGINDSGQIVGLDGNSSHGFLATPEASVAGTAPQPPGLLLALFGIAGAGLYAWRQRKKAVLA